uniref:Uncharacterized protein n=1 Tax=Fagus sylvatica TaxID=28930 RepID=A0A2N9H2J9_FAGSY
MKEGTMCFGLLRRAQFSPIKSCAAAMPAYKDIYQNPDPKRRLIRLVQPSDLVTADDITDGGDGDFTVEIAVEISPGIVLRSRLWMAVGLRGAWERSNGGDGEEKAVGPCSYAVEDLSEKSVSVDRTVELEEEEEENERCEKKSMDR